MKKEKSEIKIGAILSYLIVGINILIGFVYTPILIRKLGQAEYGLYSLVYSFMSYLTILDFGLGSAIIVYTSKSIVKKDKDEEYKLNGILFIVYTIIGIISLILGLLLFFNIENMFSKTMSEYEYTQAKIMIIIFTINIALSFPATIFKNIIIAYEKFTFNKIVKIIEIATAPIVTLPFLFIYPKAWIIVLITAVLSQTASLFNVVFAIKKLRVKLSFKNLDFGVLKEVFSYSFYVFLTVIVDKINWSVDQVILGAATGTLTVAVYAVGAKINHLFNTLSTALIGVTLPKISKMEEEKKEISEFNKIFIQTGRIQFIILAMVFSGFIIFGKNFLGFWAGKGYDDAYYITILLMSGGIIPLVENIATGILRVKNKHKVETLVVLLVAIANVAISIFLVKIWGAIGAAFGTFITLIIGEVIILNIYYKKSIGLNTPLFLKEIIKMSIPIAMITIPSFYIYKYLIPNNIIYLGLGMGIFVLLYLFVVWNFSMNKEEKKQVREIFNKGKNILKKRKESKKLEKQ